MSKGCPGYRRKKAAEIVREIVRAADRGDCERASRLLKTNQAMGASECMRVVGFSRVARRVYDCWRRPPWTKRRGRTTLSGASSGADKVERAVREYLVELQEIQKRNPPDSPEWIRASKEINALCKTMAKRSKACRG